MTTPLNEIYAWMNKLGCYTPAIKEALNERILLMEDQYTTKEAKRAISLCKKHGMTKDQAKTVVDEFMTQMGIEHTNDERFHLLLGFTRMYLNGEFNDEHDINTMKKILRFMKQKGQCKEYSENFDDMSFNDIKEKYLPAIQDARDADNAERENNDFSNEDSEYDIVRVDDYDTSSQYSDYTCPESQWCITYGESHFRDYGLSGPNQAYFCLKKGFENIPPEKGPNFPLDEYGLSMICVIVDPEGEIEHVTTRWNHASPQGEDNDKLHTKAQVEALIHKDFDSTFPPNPKDDYLSYEEYREALWDDEVCIYSDYDNDVYAVLSQDRDPYASEWHFVPPEHADYYLYLDDSSEYVAGPYSKNVTVRTFDGIGFLIENGKGFDFFFMADDYSETRLTTAINLPGDSDTVIGCDSDTFYIFQKDGTKKEVSLTVDPMDLTEVYRIDEYYDNLYAVPSPTQKGTWNIVNMENEDVIINEEIPANGERFEVSDTTLKGEGITAIVCGDGRMYDCEDGFLYNEDPDNPRLRVLKELTPDIAIVETGNHLECLARDGKPVTQLYKQILYQPNRGVPYLMFYSEGMEHNNATNIVMLNDQMHFLLPEGSKDMYIGFPTQIGANLLFPVAKANSTNERNYLTTDGQLVIQSEEWPTKIARLDFESITAFRYANGSGIVMNLEHMVTLLRYDKTIKDVNRSTSVVHSIDDDQLYYISNRGQCLKPVGKEYQDFDSLAGYPVAKSGNTKTLLDATTYQPLIQGEDIKPVVSPTAASHDYLSNIAVKNGGKWQFYHPNFDYNNKITFTKMSDLAFDDFEPLEASYLSTMNVIYNGQPCVWYGQNNVEPINNNNGNDNNDTGEQQNTNDQQLDEIIRRALKNVIFS